MFMVSRRINDSQNYVLLEHLQYLTKIDDLEVLAIKVTDALADMDAKDPYTIYQTFSRGKILKKKERYHVAYLCISCGVLEHDERVMGICGDICGMLEIRQSVVNDMLQKAIQDTGPYRVMGYSEPHLAVKPIIDEALARTTPPRPPSS